MAYGPRYVERLSKRVIAVVEREEPVCSSVIAEACDFASPRKASWFVKKYLRKEIQVERTPGSTQLTFKMRRA